MNTEIIATEKIEILKYNLARVEARPNQELWADEAAAYRREITRIESDTASVFVPCTYQDRAAHEYQLRLARGGVR